MKGKSIVTTLSVLFLSVSALTLIGCETKKNSQSEQSSSIVDENPELVDFENISKTMELGEIYHLPNGADDTNGVAHLVSYSAVNEQGQGVALNKFDFECANLGVFTIKGTAFLKNQRYERTITLTVVDTTAPEITIGRAKRGYKFKRYTLPEITTYDVSGETIDEIGVFLVDTDPETEMTISNNSFTPITSGNYEIRVTSTDLSHNTNSKTVQFTVYDSKVPEELDPDEVIDFKEDEDIDNITFLDNVNHKKDYLDEYEGETGVAKISFYRDWPSFQFTSSQSLSAFQGYDYLVIRAFVKSGQNQLLYMSLIDGGDRKDDLMVDEWFDYRFDINLFLNNWKNDGTPKNDVARIQMHSTTYEVWGDLYISSIKVVKEFKILLDELPTGTVNQEYLIPTPEVRNAIGEYTLEKQAFYIDEEDEIELDITDNKFTPTHIGRYVIKFIARDSEGNVAYKEVSIYVDPVDDIRADEVLDFDEMGDLSAISQGSKPEDRYAFSILEEYHDEIGVLKIESIDDCTTLQIERTAHPKSYYADFDYVTIRAYVKGGKAVHHMSIMEDGSNIMYGDTSANRIAYNEWKDYRFNINTFNNNAKPWFMWYTDGLYGTKGEIYISDIRVESPAKVLIGNPSNGVVGEEYVLPNISAINFSGTYTLSVKVYLVQGQSESEVSISNNKFTPVTAGTYRIRARAYDGSGNDVTAEKEFLVLAAPDVARDDEVIDFDESTDVNFVAKGPRDTAYNFSHLDDYQGENGVLKVSTVDECITVCFNEYAHEKSYYNSYTYIVFRLYLPNAKRVHHLCINSEQSDIMYYDLDGGRQEIVYNQWHDYAFKASQFFGSSAPNLFMYTYERTQGDFYVSDIRVTNTL